MPALPLIAIFEVIAQFGVGATSTIGTAYMTVGTIEMAMGQVGYIAGFGRRIIVGGLAILGAIGGTAGAVMIPDNLYIPPVEHIREITELSLVEYNYAEIVASQTDMPAFIGALYGQEVVIVAVGTVTAGFELSNLNEDSIEFERQNLIGGEYILYIPEPELLRCYLNEDKTYVAERRRAAFAPTNTAIDDSVRTFAVQTFSEMALEEEILVHAKQRFEGVLGQTLTAINFKGKYRIEYIPNEDTGC